MGDTLHPVLSAAPTDAASELLVREEAALRRIIGRYVRHATVIDDIFQEISLKVMRRIDSVRDQQALRGWLFQLARNACLDWLRAQGIRVEPVALEDLFIEITQ